MSNTKRYLLLITYLLFSLKLIHGQELKNYDFYLGIISDIKKDSSLIILRKFTKNKQTYFFAVDPYNLKTTVFPGAGIPYKPARWETVRETFANTPYIKALIAVEKNDTAIQNAGITTTHPLENGAILTIDLCPAPKPMNRKIFDDALSAFSRTGITIPVVISVSGRWMVKHKSDMKWLLEVNREKLFDIIWMNHGTYHRVAKYFPAVQSQKQQEPINEKVEVYQNEILMLEWEVTPSVFFRFPGLLSDSISLHRVINSGLIPIGSDAWLAKNQQPVNGSIILVHGNGNEPNGVVELSGLFIRLKNDIILKNWRLLDLRKSLSATFSH